MRKGGEERGEIGKKMLSIYNKIRMINVWASNALNKVIVRVDYSLLFKTCYNRVTEHDQQHKHGCHICTVCVHSASKPRQ